MSETEFNWGLSSFNEIIEYVAEMVDGDFKLTVNIANDILENPGDYTGLHAAVTAKKLAAYRIKMSVATQYLKLKCAQTKHPRDRLMLNALASMSDNILELINTLKLAVRAELD